MRKLFDSDARLSWVLAAMAGLVGAAAFMHTEGYFVTFMTGNSERSVLGWFTNNPELSISATCLIVSFIIGVVVGSLFRRHVWHNHQHGVTALTTGCLAVASLLDFVIEHYTHGENDFQFGPILLVAFGIGALNTAFVKDGEVSVPLSYVTGTLVKMGQGIERHISGKADATAWLNYFLLYTAFITGAVIGGCLGVLIDGASMLSIATVWCAITTAYTHIHENRHGPVDA